MRDSLYIKDDDYRYSFLFGNFITLSNLKEQDWRRLEEQRLSPLYVSVHTTNPELRRKMVDGPRSGEIVEQIQRLGAMGIQCHTQLVLCPEINDGDEVDRSIAELAALRPTVQSISVVPVGLTKYNNMLKVGALPPMRPYALAEAEAVMARVAPWQERFAAEPDSRGLPFLYLSDEWYYTTKRSFPPARHYGEYAQVENGVGMTRKLLDDWRQAKRSLRAPDNSGSRPRVGVITSTMAEPVMAKMLREAARLTRLEIRVAAVENQFFGPLVTVAGLLTALDTLEAIAARFADFTGDDLLLLPRVMLDNAGARFLDDMTVEEFRAQAPAPVIFAKTAEEIVAALNTSVASAAVRDGAMA
jgi:putative radical SAM enzyme (TIGR03279 family)